MSTEILGMVGTKDASEIRGSYTDGPAVDADYLTRFARAHEDAGFDRVLIGYSASAPDGFAVASHVLNATSRLKVLIAHRPGFVQPTVVARKLATLDQLTGGGRVAIHHITGGSDGTVTGRTTTPATCGPPSSSRCCGAPSPRPRRSTTPAGSTATSRLSAP
jgi:alkanesulfonate monooxygenase